MKNLTWDDTNVIVKMLSEKYPDTPPVALSKEKIREKVIALEGFTDSPFPSHRIDLTAIKRSWIMLWHGTDAEKSICGNRTARD